MIKILGLDQFKKLLLSVGYDLWTHSSRSQSHIDAEGLPKLNKNLEVQQDSSQNYYVLNESKKEAHNSERSSQCNDRTALSSNSTSNYIIKNVQQVKSGKNHFTNVWERNNNYRKIMLRDRSKKSNDLKTTSDLKFVHRKNKCYKNMSLKPFYPFAIILHKIFVLCVSSSPESTSLLRKSCREVGLYQSKKSTARRKLRNFPSMGATSFFTILTLICLEMILLSTVSTCAKTFYMHWNTSNSIFRIDNTDHIIDVNKGNLAFEFDQVHIICPVYEPGTFENETEKYIIYNVSKVEYETCRITNADPRVIAICDKPQKLMFFTITFRPFTPQPGGLEFLPGNDYYFISTSSKDDLYRRIGGRCSTNNMKVVFKVCCSPEVKNKTLSAIGGSGSSSSGSERVVDIKTPNNINQQHNNINTVGINGVNSGLIPGGGISINNGNSIQLKPIPGPSSTSINTNIDQFNRIPLQSNGINMIGNNMASTHSVAGGTETIMLTPGHDGINMIPSGNGNIGQYHPGQSGIRINNVPPQQNYPSYKNNHNNNDVHYDKHPNEVVKNEELTYNSAASPSVYQHSHWFCWISFNYSITAILKTVITSFSKKIIGFRSCWDLLKRVLTQRFLKKFSNRQSIVKLLYIISKSNPIVLLSVLLVMLAHKIIRYTASPLKLYTKHFSKYVSISKQSVKSSFIPAKKNSLINNLRLNMKRLR